MTFFRQTVRIGKMAVCGAKFLRYVDSLDTLYAKNANEQLDPASLTKVMTALVALKHGSPEQLLTASGQERRRQATHRYAFFDFQCHLYISRHSKSPLSSDLINSSADARFVAKTDAEFLHCVSGDT